MPDDFVSDLCRPPSPPMRLASSRLEASSIENGGGSIAGGKGRSIGLPGGVGGSARAPFSGSVDERHEEYDAPATIERRSMSADIRFGDMAADDVEHDLVDPDARSMSAASMKFDDKVYVTALSQ